MLTRVTQIVITETFNLARTDLLMDPDRTPKPGQHDLLYGSKSPADKLDVNTDVFRPAEPHSPHICLLLKSSVWKLSYLLTYLITGCPVTGSSSLSDPGLVRLMDYPFIRVSLEMGDTRYRARPKPIFNYDNRITDGICLCGRRCQLPALCRYGAAASATDASISFRFGNHQLIVSAPRVARRTLG